MAGPGLHFKVPIIQKYQVEETKHTTLDLEPQVIQLQDDLVYEVDAKVMYQIVDLKKAIIQIDDLVTGLQNRVVLAVQKVVGSRDRHTVLQTDEMVTMIRDELRAVEDQWGVRILQFGFSNISPSPTTLEITQLELLTAERLELYQRLRGEGMAPEAAVALITGAVIATHPPQPETSWTVHKREEEMVEEKVDQWATSVKERLKREAQKAGQESEDEDGEGEDGEDGAEQER